MQTGIVKFFKNGKGYGFIVPDRGGPDVFVHITDVFGRQPLVQGMRVAFQVAIDRKQRKAKAADVQVETRLPFRIVRAA